MQALYWQPPKPEELRAWGLTAEDCPPPGCDLWEENWPAVRLFVQCETQWRMGMNGPVGLDYNVVFHELDRQGLVGEEYDELMASVRIMESEALTIIRERR